MGFRVAGLEFHKVVNGSVKGVSVHDTVTNKIIAFIPDNEWVSVITEMSHKPENAEQHAEAEKFNLGGK